MTYRFAACQQVRPRPAHEVLDQLDAVAVSAVRGARCTEPRSGEGRDLHQ